MTAVAGGGAARGRRPVLIGWNQVSRFEGEPLAVWAEALRGTGVPPSAVDSLDVVYCQSWPYDDPAGRLAAEVGASPRLMAYSGIGGTTPISLVAAAARRVQSGELDVAAVVGGEQLATVRRAKKQGERPDWSFRDPVKRPFPFEAPFHPAELAHQVFQAYTTFALRDTARRARLGATVADYSSSIGGLFAPMTEVAAANPNAWFPQRRSAGELMEVTSANRIVAHPYTKLVTAIMDVDLGGAVVVASEEAADRLGVPLDRRVHLRGWAEDRDPNYVAEHPDLSEAPAMGRALTGALAAAGVGVDDVAHFDLYSCFPSSVWFALDALGLHDADSRRPFTVTGGLPYAGGPGSCYTLLSLAAMAETLVAEPGSLGLVTAVGMHLSKHAAMALSTEPGPDPAASTAIGSGETEPPRSIVETFEGRALILGYTVHHGSDGHPSDALAVCEVAPGGPRSYARSDDPELMADMEEREFVGQQVTLRPLDGGVNRMTP